MIYQLYPIPLCDVNLPVYYMVKSYYYRSLMYKSEDNLEEEWKRLRLDCMRYDFLLFPSVDDSQEYDADTLTREVIMPALERGAVVVCDRYCDSTFAYQAAGRGLSEQLVRDANAMGSCGLAPDRTIVFDLEVDESFERATRHGTDRMELDGEPFQQRVREGFLRLAAEEPERVRVVNAHGEKLEVYARMRAELIDLFPELGEEAV